MLVEIKSSLTPLASDFLAWLATRPAGLNAAEAFIIEREDGSGFVCDDRGIHIEFLNAAGLVAAMAAWAENVQEVAA